MKLQFNQSQYLTFVENIQIVTEGNCPMQGCNEYLDSTGSHSLSCNCNGRIQRHNDLRNIIVQFAREAKLNPSTEPPNLIPEKGQARPADMFLSTGYQGDPICFDVSVVSPLTNKIVRKAAQTPLAAADDMVETKDKKYAHFCYQQGYQFEPLVVEIFGGWASCSLQQLKVLQRSWANAMQTFSGLSSAYFFQRISVCLQKSNANMLLSMRHAIQSMIDNN